MPKSNRNCAVGGCSHTQRTCPKGRFVGFPNEDKQPGRRAMWIGLVQRGSNWVPTKNSRVCGCHFSGGYKVDDPNDPAYNPSIFPVAPELDRRVRKTMMEEMYLQKLQAHHQAGLGASVLPPDAPLQPSSNQANDADDIMKYVSAALDLSKEAGEEYASAVQSERDETSLTAAPHRNGPSSSSMSSTKEAGSQEVTGSQRENAFGVSTTALSACSQLIMGGPMSAEGKMRVGNHQAKDDQRVCNSAQSRGWLYINQARSSGSAINLAGDGNETVLRKRRVLHASRPQNATRFQRFAVSTRKGSGNATFVKHPRNVQGRYIMRIGGSSVVDRHKATDLSLVRSSEQGPSSSGPSQNHVLPTVSVKTDRLRTNCHSQASVQTVLSMAGQSNSDSGVEQNGLSARSSGRCRGFHGWSDICFSDTTIQRITGVSPHVFDLLLDHLPEDTPGLPPHNSLLLSLMKLKMAVPFELLASVFSLSAATTCNIFTHTLSVLFTTLSVLIHWPRDSLPSDALRNSTQDCSIIIDFVKIQIECPSTTEHQSPTSSIATDSIKILVGIKPNGFICFVSSAYEGSANNAQVFENSGLLDKLDKNSKVLLLQQEGKLQQTLRSKGFKVLVLNDSLGSCLNKNSFTGGKSSEASHPDAAKMTTHLSGNSKSTETGATNSIMLPVKSESVDCLPECSDGSLVQASPPSTKSNSPCQSQGSLSSNPVNPRKIASHLRTFNILNNLLESSLLPYVDEIVTVCAALNNLQEPVT